MTRRSLALMLVLASATARAADLHVDRASGNDGNDGLGWASAKASVTAALAAAALTPEADVVSVAGGIYAERITFPPDVTLLGGFPSGGGPRDPVMRPTILDGGFGGTVVTFPPGTDACILDGFVVRRGRNLTDPQFFEDARGGGLTVLDASPAILNCVIEGNYGHGGGGFNIVLGAPYFQDCLVRRNSAEYQAGGAAVGDGATVVHFVRTAFVANSASALWSALYLDIGGAGVVELDPVMDDCLVAANAAWTSYDPMGYQSAALEVNAAGRAGLMKDVLVRGNLDGGVSCRIDRRDPFTWVNCEFSGHARAAIDDQCWGLTFDLAHFENCTIAGNEFAMMLRPRGFESWARAEFHRCLVADRFAPAACVVYHDATDCLMVHGWPPPFTGTNILAADPLFVPGEFGDYYLSQAASGQAQDSPAIDQGPEFASDVGLDTLGTRTDGVPDSGPVDWGVHYTGTWPNSRDIEPGWWDDVEQRIHYVAAAPGPDGLIIRRGSLPYDLETIGFVADLPYLDAPGVLSDSALPLLFYLVEWPESGPVKVEKDLANDTLRLRY